MNNYMNTVSAIATAVAAIASMVAVIISVVQQSKMREYEDKKTQSEQMLLWYNEVVLKDIISEINNMINCFECDIEKCKTLKKDEIESELKEIYDRMKEKNRILINKIYILKLFDTKLYNNCKEKILALLDIYSDIINNFAKRKTVMRYDSNRINQLKIELLELMYNQGLKLVVKWK